MPEHQSKVQFKANPLFPVTAPVAYFGAAIYQCGRSGGHAFGDVRVDPQCLFFRGDRANGIVNCSKSVAPAMACNLSCKEGPGITATVGLNCEGKLVP